jgi:hypothetical protein
VYEMPSSSTPVWPTAPPPWGQPPQRGPINGLGWAAISVAVVVAIAIVTYVALHVTFTVTKFRPLDSTATSCQETAPASASPAARAFVNTVNSAETAWAPITASLLASHYQVGPSDLKEEAAADRPYIAAIRRITFPPAAAAAARSYIRVVQSYIANLKLAISDPSYYSSSHQVFAVLDNERGELSIQLRTELGLPLLTNCTVLRP